MMKPNAIFVNTSRGKVVDEKALIRALQEGWIRGAGLDVFESEPIEPDNPLLKMDNVVLTPHTASASDYARWVSPRKAAREVVRVLKGYYPLNLLNRELMARLNLKRPTVYEP